MALNTQPEASRGIFNAIKDSFGLFGETNKAQGVGENVNPTPIDEYESKLKDSEILELASQWKRTYLVYYDPIDKTQKIAFDYWIGKQRLDETSNLKVESAQLTDNLIFESLETFLPLATRANPDPLVTASDDQIGLDPRTGQPLTGLDIARAIKGALVNEADTQKLRRKLARMTRHWAIYRIGVAKVSWDTKLKCIKTEVINPRRIIFDKDGYVDEGGHFQGEYIGEKKRTSAQTLTDMFPKKKAEIFIKCQGKLGTKLEYYEWWYKGEDVFFVMDDIVLGKYKNPNWNYDIEGQPAKEAVKDEDGNEIEAAQEETQIIQGTNHMKKRMPPFIFLSIFNVGLHPHDETSLILQNLTIQDMVNRRWRQIDQNVAGMNNGMAVSGKSFTEEQASQAASALRRGVAIRVPDGNVRDGVARIPAPALPADIFNSLKDGRNELRSIFGTSGSTPQGTKQEDTVRGKIMVSQQDSSRIGGGITEVIEQVADSIYNWWVQMMFVYFDEEHFILDSGSQGGVELLALKNSQFPLLQSLNVTVKEGSLIPKDPLTQRNEAIDLWSANAIDPLNFYKKLDFPDPANATQQLILWQMLQKGQIMPQQYLPSFQVAQPQAPPQQPGLPGQEPGTGGPAVSPPQTNPAGVQPQAPAPQSPPAVEAQGRQLIQSVPIK